MGKMAETAENARLALLGQRRNLALVTEAISSGRVAHAYLVVGPDGSGKKTLALFVAQLLVCEAPQREAGAVNVDRDIVAKGSGSRFAEGAHLLPCGTCRSCIRVKAGNHPDVRLVTPDGAAFKIDQVRDVQREAALSPYEGNLKVFIVERADLMTEEAQNSLLKTLEEPPPHSLFILLAPESTALLPTIVSRCQLLRMELLPEKMIAAELERRGKAFGQAARTAAALAGGCLGRALASLEEPLAGIRNKAVGFVEALGKIGPGECLSLAREFEKDRDGAEFFVQVLSLLYRDLAVMAATRAQSGAEEGCGGALVNRDIAEMLGREARHYDVEGCLAAETALARSAEFARLNINTRLLLDVLLLELRELRRNGRFTAAWEELLERVTA